MKRISICITLLVLTFSLFSASAQANLTTTPTSQTYENDTFKIRFTLPLTWRLVVLPSKPDYLQISSYSPSQFPVIGFIVGPHTESTTQNKPASEKTTFTNGTLETKIEGKGETTVSGNTAKWTLSFTSDHATLDTYTLIYFIPTEKQDYLITMLGSRKNYERDRKEFDDVINTFNILP